MAPNAVLTTIRTKATNSWEMKANRFSFGNDSLIFSNPERFMEVDPQLPYFYVPNDDWTSISEKMSEIYLNEGLNCDFENNLCLFNKPCS